MRDLVYDPEMVVLLAGVLAEAWERMPTHRQSATTKSQLAVRILYYAAEGEWDRNRLIAYAIAA